MRDWLWPGLVTRSTEALSDDDAEVRRDALVELGEVRGRRTRALLVDALRDEAPSVREAAIDSIRKRRERKAIPALLPLLRDRLHHRDAQGVLVYPIRARALDCLRALHWKGVERIASQMTIKKDSIVNHEKVVYFLGAGFARCYGLPLASGMGEAMFPFLWKLVWPVQRFLQLHFSCHTVDDARRVALSDVIDQIQRLGKGNQLARNVDDHVSWWIRQEFKPSEFGLWRLENEMLLRFVRFLANNGLENFVVTTNWDNFLDIGVQQVLYERETMKKDPESMSFSNTYWDHSLRYVDYHVDPELDRSVDDDGHPPIHLYKINGSADWLHCEQCRLLFSWYFPWQTYSLHSIHVDGFHYDSFPSALRCPMCEEQLGPVLMMPSPLRPQNLLSRALATGDHHVEFHQTIEPGSILSKMRERISGATLWVFIGYSLPEYDRDVIELVRGALAASPSAAIDVVDFVKEPMESYPLAERYREILGREIGYFPFGVERWIETNIPDYGVLLGEEG